MSREQANALAALEADIAEVTGAEAVLQIVSRVTLERLSAEAAAVFHIPASASEAYRIYALSPDEDDALHHALLHLGDLIHRLNRNYQQAAETLP